MTLPVHQTPGQPSPRNLGQMIANLGPQSALVETSTVDPRALAAGIKPSFASVTFKGKTWGIRYRGVTQQLLAYGQHGEILGSIPTIDVVVLKSATAISKTFYIDKFKEGSFAPPDCWSTNGQVPDLASAKKQSETCRGCKWDAFGSRTMDDGRKGKACSDNKRVAVVPATDLKNEAYGGPMLLKLPPSAFNGLSELENQLHLQGYRYYGIVMRLSFDHEQAFPKILFTPLRTLSDEELKIVIELQTVDTTERILNEELYEVSGDPGQPIAPEHAPTQPAQPQTTVSPGVTPVNTGVSHPQTAFDPGPIPGHLVRTPAATPANPFAQPTPDVIPMPAPVPTTPTLTPQLTPEQQKIAELEAQLAAAKAPPPPPPPALTPEQQKIKDLEAQLAAAKAGAAPQASAPTPAAAPPKPRQTRKRTAPVTPTQTGTQTQAGEPVNVPLPLGLPALAGSAGGNGAGGPVLLDASSANQNVAGPVDGAADDDEGDAPPDLDSRISNLLGNTDT